MSAFQRYLYLIVYAVPTRYNELIAKILAISQGTDGGGS